MLCEDYRISSEKCSYPDLCHSKIQTQDHEIFTDLEPQNM